MAKFYSIILPSMDASPEMMYFSQKQTLFSLKFLPYNCTEKEVTLSAAVSIFQVKSTHTEVRPARCFPCGTYDSHSRVTDLCIRGNPHLPPLSWWKHLYVQLLCVLGMQKHLANSSSMGKIICLFV